MKSLFSEANNSFPGTNHIFEEKTSKFLNNYLWKFGCKLSVICALACGTPWVQPRFWSRDILVFSSLKRYVCRGLMCPPPRFEYKVFWAQYHALVAVWRTCVSLTSVFICWIGSWRTRPQKSALL